MSIIKIGKTDLMYKKLSNVSKLIEKKKVNKPFMKTIVFENDCVYYTDGRFLLKTEHGSKENLITSGQYIPLITKESILLEPSDSAMPDVKVILEASFENKGMFHNVWAKPEHKTSFVLSSIYKNYNQVIDYSIICKMIDFIENSFELYTSDCMVKIISEGNIVVIAPLQSV